MEQETLSREQLYNLLWTTPMMTLSRKYHISDNGLRKICGRLNIPIPKAGYWQKVQHGKKITKTSLSKKHDGDQTVILSLRDESSKTVYGEVSSAKVLQADIEKSIPHLLKAPDRLSNPDRLTIAAKDYLKQQQPDKWNYIGMVSSGNSVLDTRVTLKSLPRALRFWDTLIKALRGRGHEIQLNYSKTKAIIDGIGLEIFLREKSKKEVYKDGKWDRTRYLPTGTLYFQTSGYTGRTWTDGKLQLEEQLSRIIANLELSSAEIKKWRLHSESLRAEREEQERLKQEYKNTQKAELAAFRILLENVSRWQKANTLRSYIGEVEAKASKNGNANTELKDWLAWARKKADWYDPFVESHDELLNGIDRNKLET